MNADKRNASRHLRLTTRITIGLVLLFGLFPPALAAAEDDPDRITRLVDKIARGDEVEAAAASEQLIEQLTAPLADAIGPLNDRPVEEQVRLRRVIARLTGALQMRVCRLNLPPEDRELFDRFAAAYPELVHRLFDGNYRVRKAAVQQIPLEPNTGAGVLVAAKVDDEDGDVATTALEVAAALHDSVVARNLTRYVADATATVESGFYGPEDQDLARIVAVIVAQSISVIGAAGTTESVPAIIDALRFFGHSKYWDQHYRSLAVRSLGQLGDRRAAPVLVEFLDDPARLRWRSTDDGERLLESVGDVALLSLLRLYELKPVDFGLVVPARDSDFAGYPDDDARREGHRAFRIWHQQHAGPQSTRPGSPTSRPTRE
jgi:hypothetical protein